jgi:protein-tyrosine phosphatase
MVFPDAQQFCNLPRELQAALEAGKRVVVHSRMGIGRSSLVAAGLLVAEGKTVPEAFEVSTARGMPVPDTDAPWRWLQPVMSDIGSPRSPDRRAAEGVLGKR